MDVHKWGQQLKQVHLKGTELRLSSLFYVSCHDRPMYTYILNTNGLIYIIIEILFFVMKHNDIQL